jgi:lysophospholipase L1-like esterase
MGVVAVGALLVPAGAQADPYIAIGDSYTGGFGSTVYTHYQVTLGATQFLSKATGGASSSSALSSQVPSAVADINSGSDTKAVTIMIGGADGIFGSCQTNRDEPACPLRSNLDQILDALQLALAGDPGDEPLTVAAYPNPSQGGPLEQDRRQRLLGADETFDLTDTTGPDVGINEVIHQVAAANGVSVVDPYDEFVACGVACVQGDDLHPSSQGYAIIANLFCGGICQTLAGGGGGGGTGGDTTAPETIVTAKPKSKTEKKRVRIEFTSSEAGSSFECDTGKGFEPCTSPLKVKSKRGRNRVQIRARDAAGNLESTPEKISWRYKKDR